MNSPGYIVQIVREYRLAQAIHDGYAFTTEPEHLHVRTFSRAITQSFPLVTPPANAAQACTMMHHLNGESSSNKGVNF